MPNIVFVSSKGGAGKTTSAKILADELSNRKLNVKLIDADPNHPISKWQERGGTASNLCIDKNDDENELLNQIDNAAEEYDFVIVDLEGTANMAAAYAVAKADLVIVPCQRSTLDANEAAKSISLVKAQSNVTKRNIPVSVLLTRTSAAIRSKGMKRMINSLDSNGIDTFITELCEREAFKALFDHSKTLYQLTANEVSGLDKAKYNAAEFAVEVIQKLTAHVESKDERLVEELVQ